MATLPVPLASLPPPPSTIPHPGRGLLPTPVIAPSPVPIGVSPGVPLTAIRRSARRARSPTSQASGGSRPRTRQHGAPRGAQARAQCVLCFQDFTIGHLPRHAARCQARVAVDDAQRVATNTPTAGFIRGGINPQGGSLLGVLTPPRGIPPSLPPPPNWVLNIPELPGAIFQPSRVHLVTHIPAAARAIAAATLRQVLRTILDDHIPIGPWHVFLAFPRLILRKPH